MTLRFGRYPRVADPGIRHLESLVNVATLTPPPYISWDTVLPSNVGMMLNDQLSDCVEAGAGHGLQVWTAEASGTILTPTDQDIEQLYEEAAGYVPGDPSTDNGSTLTEVLAYWMKTGIQTPRGKNLLAGRVEINPRDPLQMKSVIAEMGFAYVGFNVPAWFADAVQSDTLPDLWDVNPSGDNTIVDGHCVVLPAYGPKGHYDVISWGSKAYRMTPAFAKQFVNEGYGLLNETWLEANGKTPYGMTWAQLQAAMGQL